MNNVQLVSIVVGITLGVMGAILICFPILQKKGVKVDVALQKVDTILDGADKIIDVAKVVAPFNPVVSVLDKVEKYAHIGVNQAQQLYLTSQLTADERNEKARDTINAALKTLNIEITPEIQKIIDGAIESEVLALGHKDDSAKIIQKQLELSNQQLQAQLVVQTQKAQDLETQNVTLTQTLATIKNTVQ